MFRIGGLFLLVLGLFVGHMYMAVSLPHGSRSANTGLPDSGPLGWAASILFVVGLALLLGGGGKLAS